MKHSKITYSIFGITENLNQSLMNFDPHDSCGMTLEHCHWFCWNVWIPDPNHVIQTACHQDVQILVMIKRLDALLKMQISFVNLIFRDVQHRYRLALLPILVHLPA